MTVQKDEEMEKMVGVTVLVPSGRPSLDLMDEVLRIAREMSCELYLSTLQNIRLLGVPESKVPEVQARLKKLGATFKGPGLFPIPRVCVGKEHCNLGLVDTSDMSRAITDAFAAKEKNQGQV